MNRQKDALGVGRRVAFFDYIFERGSTGAGRSKPLSDMVFQTKEDSLSLRQNSEYVDNRVTHMHQSYEQTTHHVYPIMHLTSARNFIYNSASHIVNRIANRYDDQYIKIVPAVTDIRHILYSSKEESRRISQSFIFKNPVQQREISEAPVRGIFTETAVEKPAMVFHKKSETVHHETMKALEERIVTRVTEKIQVQKSEAHTHTFTKEERIVHLREEKALSDKLYASVMKKWDRELKRKGHIYG